MERRTTRILLVEDEPDLRDTLVELLTGDGWQILIAADGMEALQRIAGGDVDLVLLDVGLPGISGFDVLHRLREEHDPIDLPVIMLTGVTTRDAVVKALGMGANDYVIKPLDIRIVRARIQTQLTTKHAVDERRRLERELARRNLELERANRELAQANGHMLADLASAARLQQALLPAALPEREGLRFSWMYRPCSGLAGDTLNVFDIDADHVGMYLLDVSGHGVKAALLSVALNRLLAPRPGQPCLVHRQRGRRGALEPTPPREVAEELNRRFQFDEALEQYFTLFYGLLDTRTRELRYVTAGHPGPVFSPPDRPATDLTQSLFAIGWVPEPNYPERRLRLRRGDRVYVYSDGIDEARNAAKEAFGRQRIVGVVQETRAAGLDESMHQILQAAERWTAGPFADDISALALEIAE